jgi:hypothetical protein
MPEEKKKIWQKFNHSIILGDFSDLVVKYLYDCDAKFDSTSKIDGTNSKIVYYPSSGVFSVGGKTDNATSQKGQFHFLNNIGNRILPMLKEMYPREISKFVPVIDEGKHILYYVDDNGEEKVADVEDMIASKLSGKKFKVSLEESPIYFYGEYYGAGIQKGGGYIKDGNDFVLFDILQQGRWTLRDEFTDLTDKLGIKTVPYNGLMTIKEAEEMVKKGFKTKMKDVSNPDMIEEGLVLKTPNCMKDSYGNRIILKVKYEDYNKLQKVIDQVGEDEYHQFHDWYMKNQKEIELLGKPVE